MTTSSKIFKQITNILFFYKWYKYEFYEKKNDEQLLW